jgi:hypothetical protein
MAESSEYEVRLADDDDLERFGSKPLEIGFPAEPWPSEREREQFEQENQEALELYDAEEVSVTRKQTGKSCTRSRGTRTASRRSCTTVR